jgi:hypothetical protein
LILVVIAVVFINFFLYLFGCTNPEQKPVLTQAQMVAKGEYLVNAGHCNDCHTPKLMTKDGPVPDETKLLEGSPEGMPLPKIDTSQISPGKWYLGSSDLTAWVGPWGISYAVNLTPDSATGSGTWTEELFIKILRTGKFMGSEAGRPIMPPMPWLEIGKMTDEDLKCIFAYLKSIPPKRNSVHAYVPPNEIISLQ